MESLWKEKLATFVILSWVIHSFAQFVSTQAIVSLSNGYFLLTMDVNGAFGTAHGILGNAFVSCKIPIAQISYL